MDRSLRFREIDRRTVGSLDPSCPHSRDEWRKLSAQAQPQSPTIINTHHDQNNAGLAASMRFGTRSLYDKHTRQSAAKQQTQWPPFTPRIRSLIALRLTEAGIVQEQFILSVDQNKCLSDLDRPFFESQKDRYFSANTVFQLFLDIDKACGPKDASSH